jgi:rubredoxin
MQHSPRKMIWLESPNVAGWGCSACAWMFNPAIPPLYKSLDEITRKLQAKLSEEFAAHVCAEHPIKRRRNG